MKEIILSVAGLWLVATVSWAAEAAFSKDGKTVYCCRDDGLVAVHLEPYSEEPVDLAGLIGPGEINAVTLRTTDGALLIGTKTTVWAFDPEKRTAEKLFENPEAKSQVDDLAFDPVSEGVLLTLWSYESMPEHWAWWLAKGDKTPKPLFVRRIETIKGPVFSPKGELFFGTEGDIWRGGIEHDSYDAETNRGGTLVAVRYAPVGVRETYQGTPMQIGAREIAWAGKKLVAHVARMGGSGWGKMVRLDVPLPTDPSPGQAVVEELKQRLQTYQRALASVEVLDDNPARCNLCSSMDGRRVFYTISGKPFLSKDNKVPTLVKSHPATSAPNQPKPKDTPVEQ